MMQISRMVTQVVLAEQGARYLGNQIKNDIRPHHIDIVCLS